MKRLAGRSATEFNQGLLAAIAGGVLLSAHLLCAASPQVLSARDPSLAQPLGGNGDSVAPWISNDGRYTVFSSSANNLVTNDNSRFGLDVFLRDRTTHATVLVSANWHGTGGGNRDSIGGQVSTNGRYVVFQSDASDLLPGDSNGCNDIFVRDLAERTNRLVSVAADGGWANGDSSDAVMTPDGRWVAFISSATNLVAGDTNESPNLFVRDLVNGTTTWVTAGETGSNSVVSSPVITPDGRYVAFSSDAGNLVPGIPAGAGSEVYLCDMASHQVIWASTNAAAIASAILNLPVVSSYHPALSDDGRYLAFKTGWTNGTDSIGSPLGAGPVVFRYDRSSDTTAIVSTNGFPAYLSLWLPSDDVYGPEMTPDGRFIAYVEHEGTATTYGSSVRLWDAQTGTNRLVSAGPDGMWPANTLSQTPAVSRDGRYVTFLSDATNLVTNEVSAGFHIFRRDLQTGTTALVDANAEGIGYTDQSGAIPSMSADGSDVAYSSVGDGLADAQNADFSQVLVWNAAGPTNELISRRDPLMVSQTGNRASTVGRISLSDNGEAAAFTSFASDLAPNDFNDNGDVFVRDLKAQRTVLVSVGSDGTSAQGGLSYDPTLSADGRYVTFISAATNLVADDTNGASDVFRRDLQSGTTELVSANSRGGNLAGSDCWSPVTSRNGRYIAFECQTNTMYPWVSLLWRDMSSGEVRLVSDDVDRSRAISMSGDGQRLAYFQDVSFGIGPYLEVWDAGSSANIYTNTAFYVSSTTVPTSAAISPSGNRLLYEVTNQLAVANLANASNTVLYPSTVPIQGSSQWSADGRYVAIVTRSNLVAEDNNGTNDVYLCDLQTGTVTLVSHNQNGTGSADGPSDHPVVSADGRFVGFRSFASDVAPGAVTVPALFLFDRLGGTNSLLVSGTAQADTPSWISPLVLSPNAARFAFLSWNSDLVNHDLNRQGDAMAGALAVPSPVDTDGDGIPDWWMAEYFGHVTGQAGDLSRAHDDADGDGMDNLQEFLAGTIPTDPGSYLKLQVAMSAAAGQAMLSWEAAPGRSYQVLCATNLNHPAWKVCPGTVSAEGTRRLLNVQVEGSPRYFRVMSKN